MDSHEFLITNFDYFLILEEKLYKKFIDFNKLLSEENRKSTQKILEEKKYISFKNWLKDNNAIFEDILRYPVSYGPFETIGVSAKEKINPNKSILYIPSKMIINSNEIIRKSELSLILENKKLAKIKSSCLIILNIYLLFEFIKGKESFFNPYIEMIDVDNPFFWDKNILVLLDDEGLVESIENQIDEIKQYYELFNNFLIEFINTTDFKFYLENFEKEYIYKLNLNSVKNSVYDENFKKIKITAKDYLEKVNFEIFKKFYCFVLSRNFMITDDISILVPFADSLNHECVDVYYEFFDSKNNISKLTLQFDEGMVTKLKETNHDLFYSFISNNNFSYINMEDDFFFEFNKNSNYYNELNAISNFNSEEENTSCEKNKNFSLNKQISNFKIKGKDFFTINTGNKQIYLDNFQVFNFYGRYSNEFLLTNYGFVKFLNKYDKIRFTIKYENDENIYFGKLLEHYFKKIYNHNENFIEIKLKLKLKKINRKLLYLLRFMILYEEMEEINYNELEIKKDLFDINIEIKLLYRALEILGSTLKIKNKTYPIAEDLLIMNEMVTYEINKIGKERKKNSTESFSKSRIFYAIAYRSSQKYILLFHMKYIILIIRILNLSKEKNISIKNSYLTKIEDFDKNDNEYNFNRKIIKKYFLKNKLII